MFAVFCAPQVPSLITHHNHPNVDKTARLCINAGRSTVPASWALSCELGQLGQSAKKHPDRPELSGGGCIVPLSQRQCEANHFEEEKNRIGRIGILGTRLALEKGWAPLCLINYRIVFGKFDYL